MDLGPHAAYIWAVLRAWWRWLLAALVAWLVFDGRRMQRLLDELESRGVRRRSTSVHVAELMRHARDASPPPTHRVRRSRSRGSVWPLAIFVRSGARSSPSRCAAAIPPSCRRR